ncbi:T9SS type A sorting domain-containing protein [Flavobacterium sp.]|uniref:T9SS type A sorting domain-containing protein n=1 Tax=Flavobacterium sp. TaxID=239 RepID=UPI0038FD298F
MSYFLKNNKIILLLTLQLCAVSAYSQDILWEKSYGGKHADFLMDAKPTADYGFILAGSSLSKKSGNKTETNNGDLDYWIWKMDEKGDLDWQKNFGGSGNDFLKSITLTKDGGFILAGTSNSDKEFDKADDSKGQEDFWIIKLDAKGGVEWQKTIGGSWQERIQTIIQTKEGGYILGGSSTSNISGDKINDSFGNLDYWILKLDTKGKIEWQKTMGGIYEDELRSIEQTKDNGYILGGYSNSPISGNKTEDNIGVGDYWIIKLNDKGIIEWQKTIGGDQDDQLYVVHQTYDKTYIVGGSSNSSNSKNKTKENGSGTDFWLLKLDELGIIKWQETYNFGKVDVLTSLVENEDHSFLIGGYAQSEVSENNVKGLPKKKEKKGINDYIALKINENGEEIWNKAVGSDDEDILSNVIETRDGGYLLSGTSNGKSSRDKNGNIGSNDFWVVKLKDTSKPEKIKVTIEALPNPVVTFTNIIVNYEYSEGTATLYDLNGRQLEQNKIHGERTVPFNLSNLPSGIYIINIDTNTHQEGIKIIKQ